MNEHEGAQSRDKAEIPEMWGFDCVHWPDKKAGYCIWEVNRDNCNYCKGGYVSTKGYRETTKKRYECIRRKDLGFCTYKFSGGVIGGSDADVLDDPDSKLQFCLAPDTERSTCSYVIEFKERKWILKGLFSTIKIMIYLFGLFAIIGWLLWNAIDWF